MLAILATLAAASSLVAPADAFRPAAVPSIGSSAGARTLRLWYVRDRESTADGIRITTTKTPQPESKTATKRQAKREQRNSHGYVVANHDNERSFWLHALENLESSSSLTSSLSSSASSSTTSDPLWATIAHAFSPDDLLEACEHSIPRDAFLARVGDTDLDIALVFPRGSLDPAFSASDEKKDDRKVVSVSAAQRNRSRVTIRVPFPGGSSFDKDAFTFEDELAAVIEQVRLLERTANEKLEKAAM